MYEHRYELCVCVYVHMHVELEVDAGWISQLLSTLFFEAGYLTDPGAHTDQ